jgi:purine-binding chemotaxis protein CheW
MKMSTKSQFCTFYLNNLYLGIDVMKVQEVLRYQDMTRVPLAPAIIRGLINLRGQIVTAVDMRKRLELPERERDFGPPMNVIIRTESGTAVSLLVDEIGDVVEVSDDIYERVPETLCGAAREIIQGAYKLPGQLLLIMNTEAAVNCAEPATR